MSILSKSNASLYHSENPGRFKSVARTMGFAIFAFTQKNEVLVFVSNNIKIL